MKLLITTTKLQHSDHGLYTMWTDRADAHHEALVRAGFVFTETECRWGDNHVTLAYQLVGPIEMDLTIEQLVALAKDVGEIVVRRDGVLEIYDDHRE